MVRDELEQGVKPALKFLASNADLLKTGKWEFRYSSIRDCDGYCPITYVALKKGIKVCKEAWWDVNKELNISYSTGWIIAQAADINDCNIAVRNKLLEILNPVNNPTYGVYNE